MLAQHFLAGNFGRKLLLCIFKDGDLAPWLAGKSNLLVFFHTEYIEIFISKKNSEHSIKKREKFDVRMFFKANCSWGSWFFFFKSRMKGPDKSCHYHAFFQNSRIRNRNFGLFDPTPLLTALSLRKKM